MMKTTKSKTTTDKFEDLHFAVSQYGSEMHKTLFNMMVDSAMSKRQIISSYTKLLRSTSEANHHILKSMGIRHFSFKQDKWIYGEVVKWQTQQT